jgi:hypothetical protein
MNKFKYIFTKTQAVSSLAQIDQGGFQNHTSINHLKPIDPEHHYFKLSCEQLENMLSRYINISAVVDDPEPLQASAA